MKCPLCKWFPKEEWEKFNEIEITVKISDPDYEDEDGTKTLLCCPNCGIVFKEL